MTQPKKPDSDKVGYGQPPKASRFKKGQSGNPQGRPPKPKPQPPRLTDHLFDSFLEEEAYRPVQLRENGKTIQLPAVQAVIRALMVNAAKGNRLAQVQFLDILERKEIQYT
ncbi:MULTISPECIES: DUF5681 domain-containing protein [unclassified Iodidimonas]|jgi:hypothetical protein|uniref:DUF5681 domain-containing protein n=1 Tax=unclassified Iodidimonas TaxID=2626145 RepID=UPI002482EEFA|nr:MULTISPECIES: DUF5681 domain-containing protein [unclassified Iodidimonas]